MGFIRCQINNAPSSAGLQGLLIEAAAGSRYANIPDPGRVDERAVIDARAT